MPVELAVFLILFLVMFMLVYTITGASENRRHRHQKELARIQKEKINSLYGRKNRD